MVVHIIYLELNMKTKKLTHKRRRERQHWKTGNKYYTIVELWTVC